MSGPNLHRHLLAILALIVLLPGACSPARRDAANPALPDPVLLVSIDGLHPDAIGPELMPNLHALASAGVRARWMNPSYPTLTFPNHYTLVTGLRPDRHGIVDNTMWDPALGSFHTRDRKAVENPAWWGGEPVWNTASKAGLRTATLFWVGSEAPIGGRQPDEWHTFDYAFPIDRRVDTVLGWFERDPQAWPRFAALYFEHADVAGHAFGPGSSEWQDALRAIDAALARLLAGLQRRGLDRRLNLIVVSDHGMASTSPERVRYLEDLVDTSWIRVITAGEVLGLVAEPGHEAEVEAALLGRHDALQCWRREDLPPQWHYGSNPRIAPIVCQADLGWKVFSRQSFARWGGRVKPGSHGYAPEAPEMRAAFVAVGPAFKRGAEIEPFDNIHVYALICALLGIEPAPNDGGTDALKGALRRTGPAIAWD